ncbi:MAG: RagB/SusD family nutrient uptake outer membrane protein [Tannerella sp.]|jgi:hypothetical protein|nr:RagB/SusD family nutrient uptake outer membrane protein [Tannerella sp.]
MKNLRYLFFVAAALVCVSCSDFLDREPTSYASAGFYKSEEAIKDGNAGVYNGIYMDGLGGFGYNLPYTTFFDHFTGLAGERTQNTTIGAGSGLNPDNAAVLSLWNSLYSTVARANGVIDGSKNYLDGLSDKAKQYVAEVKVLRDYAYYMLIALYGNIPFFTAPVTVDEYDVERTDRAAVLDFILQDLEEAAALLPWRATDLGRVDKAFALGLKARAALLGGSLNYAGKGADYFRIAAAAAKEVIGQRALATNFDDLFTLNGQAKDDVKNETVFAFMYSKQGTIKTHVIAFGQVSRNTGQTGRHPLMLLADTYECIDGKRIDESPLYDPKHPQRNRDPRFNATLWMHGDTVTVNNGTLVTQVLEAYNAETYFRNNATGVWELRNNADINSGAAWASFCNAGSGYLWAKYSKETSENISSQSCNVPVMRYAEVLLTYAEAKIELNELDQSVYDAINAVRNRSHMPSVSDDRKGNQQKMRQLVRRERKVELALEGLHLIDMRRWGIGDLENGAPSYGLPTDDVRYEGMSDNDIPNFKKSDRHDLNDIASYDAYKHKLKLRDENRTWNKKYELWPVPQLAKDRSPKLGQNEGY